MSFVNRLKCFIHNHYLSQKIYISYIEVRNSIKRKKILSRLIGLFKYPIIISKPKILLEQARRNLMDYHPKPSCCTATTSNVIMKEKYDLQIIVPCYNVEKFINKCVDSIISQSTDVSYHVILIDDGSTDHTPQILDNYKNNPFISVVHLTNGGSSIARNTGIKYLFAKYIMFIDGDDYLLPNAINNLMRPALLNHYDIVEGGFQRVFQGRVLSQESYKMNRKMDPEKMRGYPWGKVFKRELWRSFNYPVGLRHQDTINSFLVFPIARKAYVIKEVVYGYTQNPLGVSKTTRNITAAIDTYWITECLDEERQKLGYKNNRKYYNKLIEQFIMNHNRIDNVPELIKESVFVLERELLLGRFSHIMSIKHFLFALSFYLNDYNKYCYYFKKLYLLK